MAVVEKKQKLTVLISDYPNGQALVHGKVISPLIDVECFDMKLGYYLFARHQKFDCSDLAIATYLQSRAFGQPFILLPAIMAGSFHHDSIFYNPSRGDLWPADLPGRNVAVRTYAQTTGVWVRGVLQHDHGVDLSRVTWVTFDDAHLGEIPDPPNCVRVSDVSKDARQMLLDGEVDAAILPPNIPRDPRLASLIRNPEAAALEWHRRTGATPINHIFTIKEELSRTQPDIVRELYRMLVASKEAARRGPKDADATPYGFIAIRKTLEIVASYAFEQKITSRRVSLDEMFDDVTRALN